MNQEETGENLIYGNNFERHPILSKLSTMDRILLSTELGTEFNLMYSRGYLDGVAIVGNTFLGVARNYDSDINDHTRAAVYACFEATKGIYERCLKAFENPLEQDI